ncbi:MAG: helix-turn-helix transcriptional regulator [Alphaproteobacteria bacterium]|nr:helix-turn-helix transcriptional regulator [Alphaproteobacteria bacterium]
MPKARSSAETLDTRLAKRLAAARAARGQTLEELAQASGVSRAMISKIERGESSPTAMMLGRLAAGLDVSLSSLFAEVEGTVEPVARFERQPLWRDPETGYIRRDVAPPGTGSSQNIVRVELPAGARVAYPAFSYANTDHHILLLSGRLRFGNGTRVFDLEAGDCLRLPEVADSWYFNPGPDPAEYLVMIVRLPGFGRSA